MKSPRDLHDLIHTLSGTERRYIRRIAMISGRETAWLQLFDAISQQQEFDEAELRGMLKGSAMLKNFSVAKHYAYQRVLSALRSYGVGRDFDSDLGDMLEDYKVLHSKGLHKQAGSVMEQMKKQSIKHDSFLRLFRAIVQEFSTAAHSTEQAALDHLVKALEDQQWVLRCIENYSLTGGVYFKQLIILRHHPTARSKTEQHVLYGTIAPLLTLTPDQLLSSTATGFYHLALGDYWEAMGDLDTARIHFDRFLDPILLDTRIGATDSVHLAEYTNALFFRLRNGLLDNIGPFVDALLKRVGRTSTGKHPTTLQVWYYERWIAAKLQLLNRAGEISEARLLMKTEAERLAYMGRWITKKYALMLTLIQSSMHLASGNPRLAIDLLYPIVGQRESDSQELNTAMLLLVIAHFEELNKSEKPDAELLESTIRSTERNLVKKGRHHLIEKAILTSMRRVTKIDTDKAKAAIFESLHEQLLELFKDSRDRSFLTTFDLLTWSRKHSHLGQSKF